MGQSNSMQLELEQAAFAKEMAYEYGVGDPLFRHFAYCTNSECETCNADEDNS